MRLPQRTPGTRERGYGLVEMLVAFTVMSIVIAVSFMALTRSQSQTASVTSVAEERQMARTAIQLLEREARMAGSGWGRSTVYTGGAASLQAVNPQYGGAASNDSLVLLGAWLASTTTTAAVPSENSNITCASVSGINVNDLVLLIEKSNNSTHMFQVTGVNTGTNTLSVSNASSYNVGHTNWPPGGFGTGSYLYKATISTYAFDSTTFRRPSLVRRENYGTPSVVAYNVDGFRVYYELQDGTKTRNPATMDMVDKIEPVVLTRTSNRGRTLRDSVWASVRPRTF